MTTESDKPNTFDHMFYYGREGGRIFGLTVPSLTGIFSLIQFKVCESDTVEQCKLLSMSVGEYIFTYYVSSTLIGGVAGIAAGAVYGLINRNKDINF